MFSVYGISGPIFRGSLEKMDRVLPLARITAAQAVAGEADEAGVAATRGRPVDAAVRAYHAMFHNDLERGPLYHAAQVMHAPVITVSADDAAAHAWRVLRDSRIHQAPVLDDTENLVGIVSAAGRLVGFVSRSDILRAVVTDPPLSLWR